jgi:hypothetical protein
MSTLAFFLVALCAGILEAQQRHSRGALVGVVGYAGFLDEATIDNAVLGGALLLHVSPRFALEPEFLYMRESASVQSYVVQMNVAWEFGAPTRVRPYLVAGAGLLHQRTEFPGAVDPTFSSNEFTGNGGLGLRIRISDRFVMSPEFRLGWEPLLRATVGLGYEFPLGGADDGKCDAT